MAFLLNFETLDLMDALDLAVLIEVEAYKRYKKFAAQIGSYSKGDAAATFASMAENEAKHGKDLLARRKVLFGDEPQKVSLNDLFDVEAPEVGAIRATMSTRQAFELALSSEQKAFNFYDQALEHITDPKIRTLFTELRDEETGHVQLVQEAMAEPAAKHDVHPNMITQWKRRPKKGPPEVYSMAVSRTDAAREAEI